MEYPAQYLAKWDRETQFRRLTGVAANDCHHNMVMIVKMVDGQTVRGGHDRRQGRGHADHDRDVASGIRELTGGHKPGDVVARVDFDPYHRSFQNVSTHVLAPELTEKAIRDALHQGRAYVSHDWICDPTGFRFALIAGSSARGRIGTGAQGTVLMGGAAEFTGGSRLRAEFPVSCHIRLMSGGKVIAEVYADRLEWKVTGPGVYRIEGWLPLDGEERGWVYSNPIYIRP